MQTTTTSKLPLAAGPFLLGNLREFRHDRLSLQRRLLAEHGGAAWFRIGPVRVLMLSDPELIHGVLVSEPSAFVKSRGFRVLRPLVGDGLVTAEGDAHARHRRLLQPAFQPKRIAGYAQTMVACAERAVAGYADGARVDAAAEMMRLTLTVVGRTLFDADVSGDAAVVARAITQAMEYVVEAATSLPLPYALPLARNRKMRRARAALDEVVYRIIRERRQEQRDRGDVLSMLLAARDETDGSGLSDLEVRDEVMTLVLAGHETTANALSWALALLSRHPNDRARVEAEVDGVSGGRLPSLDDLPRLPFTLAVLKETLRLYPPVYLFGRKSVREVRIGPHLLPRSTIVLLNVFGMHRSAACFAEPDAFLPERFLGDAERAIPKGAFLPFGAGPRVCIGNHFALVEAQLILATLASRLRMHALDVELPTAEPLVTLRPRGGLPMRVERRR
jgi:cytochrome P450